MLHNGIINMVSTSPSRSAHRATFHFQYIIRRAGEIVYLHVFGQGLVFLNTHEVALDLMDRKGSIYSDKPALVMAGELYVFAFLSFPIVERVSCRSVSSGSDVVARTWSLSLAMVTSPDASVS